MQAAPSEDENKRSKSSSSGDETALSLLTRSAVKHGGKGRASVLRAVNFASFHDQVATLGVVRSASSRHALISLPGSLVGHVDRLGEAAAGCTLRAGDVVRCVVLSTHPHQEPASSHDTSASETKRAKPKKQLTKRAYDMLPKTPQTT